MTLLSILVVFCSCQSTDYLNVILHALSHVAPLRDFFLMPSHYALAARRSALVQHFGEVLRKLWSRYVADGLFAYVCICLH
jgi:hypothetical protein